MNSDFRQGNHPNGPVPPEHKCKTEIATSLSSDVSADTHVDYFDDGPADRECPRCHGIGGDPMDDYITPCDHCGGEGYEWWK